MEFLKMKLPIALVLGALGTAAGAGGSWAMAQSHQQATDDKVDLHTQEIESLTKESQANRERVLRIEINTQGTKDTVDRIERKLDRR